MRFHVLGLQHTATNEDHVACAYTQKVLKLCRMLRAAGHHVIHYGNELSRVDCSEHVTVATARDLEQSYGHEPWRRQTYQFHLNDACYTTFNRNAVREINARLQPGDLLLCMWGHGHRWIADHCPGAVVVEPGIGYAGGHFAKYKVFESYAMLHCFLGTKPVERSHHQSWHDVVIPNYYDPADFDQSSGDGDYMLFLGRVTIAKGCNIACEIAQRTGKRLIVAGQPAGYEVPRAPNIEYVGFADKEQRRKLLAGARVVLTPSMFVEPFCGVHVEAMLSGVPVITTDWGVFTETVDHGETGWRCRTFKQFLWAVDHVDDLAPSDEIRTRAVTNFSMERVSRMYETFWSMVADDAAGRGWQSPQETEVTDLDWLWRAHA